jgi:excinuclease UvrABC nuclease subunit
MKNIKIPLKRWGIYNTEQLQKKKLKKFKDLPNYSCVYIFWLFDSPIYIGRTGNLRSRIYGHLRSKRFDEYSDKINYINILWVKNDSREVLLIERTLIRYFRPVLNSQLSK